VNITGERMLGVRGVSAADCKEVRERIAVRVLLVAQNLVLGRWWLVAFRR